MTTALLAILLAAGKPDVELKASPSVVMLPIGGRAATVRLLLKVKDGGDEDYYCPRIEWEWEDGTESSEEADCPPFAEAAKTDHERVYRRSRQYWEPGRHRVKARLYKGDRVIRSVTTTVDVRGDATPAYMRQRGNPSPAPPGVPDAR